MGLGKLFGRNKDRPSTSETGDRRWHDPDANDARQRYEGRRQERRDARDDGVYVPPTEAEALEWRDDNHPRVDKGGWLEPFPITAGNADIGLEFGPGICMYFIYVKWLGVMFLFMFALQIPIMCINNLGSYVGDYTQTLNTTKVRAAKEYTILSTTFGAIPADGVSTSYIYVDKIPGFEFYVKREDMLYGAMAMDFFGVVLFLIMTAMLARRQKQIVRMIDLDTLEVSDYTVMVKGLPADVDDPEEVRCFFELKYGKVYEVHLARNDAELLQLFFKRGAVAIKLDRAKAVQAKTGKGTGKVDKLQASLDKYDGKIRKLKKRSYYRTTAAFVTFSDEYSRNKCMSECPRGWLAKLFQSREKKFRGTHSYTVQEANPPTNILFENMEYSWLNRHARRLVTNTIVFFLLISSFFVISMLKDAEKTLDTATNLNTDLAGAIDFVKTSPTYQEARQNLNATFTAEASVCEVVLTECELSVSTPETVVGLSWGHLLKVANTDPVLNAVGATSSADALSSIRECNNAEVSEACPEHLVKCYPCYCKGLFDSISTSTKFAEVRIIHQQCGLWIAADVLKSMYKVLSVGSIVLVNLMLKALIRALVGFEKHQSISRQHASITLKIFVAQLLNTAVLSLAANADLDEMGKHLKGSILEGKIFAGDYRDFSHEWYEDLGAALCVTVAVNVTMPRLRSIFKHVWHFLTRVLKKGSAITQRELNELYTGYEFDLSGLYGEVLMNVVVVMIYSSGMPILYLILSLGLFAAALGDKHQLLKVCKRPPRYSENVSNVALAIMPWAAVLHLLMGIWVHSHFPTERIDSKVGDIASSINAGGLGLNISISQGSLDRFNSALSSATDALDEAVKEQASLNIEDRVLQTNAFPLVVLVGLITGITVVVKWLLVGGIWPVIKRQLCCCFGCCKEEIEVEGLPNIEDAIMSDQLKGIPTYALDQNPKYMDAFYEEGDSTRAMSMKSKKGGFSERGGDNDEDATVEDIERLLGMSGGGGMGPMMGRGGGAW